MSSTGPRFDSLGAATANVGDRGGFLRPLMWLGGVVAAGCAMAVGALLAVFTAVAVAVIAVVAGVVMFLMGMASRARRTTGGPRKGRRRTDDDDTVIEAHKVDGTWVAYGWERSGR